MSSSSNNDANNDEAEGDGKRSSSSVMSRIGKFMDDQRLERLKQCQEIDVVLKRCLEKRKQRQRQQMLLATGTTETTPADTDDQQMDLNLEDTIPGTRMMRYFGWHQEKTTTTPESVSFKSLWKSQSSSSSSSSKSQSSSTMPSPIEEELTRTTIDNGDESTNTVNERSSSSAVVPIPTCAMERHALWACRSVSLGCASHLGNLKDCFDEVKSSSSHRRHVVLDTYETAYEKTRSSSSSSSANNTAAVATTTTNIPCRQLQEELGTCVITNVRELQQRLTSSSSSKDE